MSEETVETVLITTDAFQIVTYEHPKGGIDWRVESMGAKVYFEPDDLKEQLLDAVIAVHDKQKETKTLE